MARFNGWFSTRWYAMRYSHRDEQDAANLVLPLIAKGGLPPGQLVLDMCCGRGRQAAVRCRKGLQVTGTDLPTEGFQEAKRLVPQARVEVGDMRKSVADGAFDAAVCLSTSLGYTDGAPDDQHAADAVANDLMPGGPYGLDRSNGGFATDHLVEQEAFVVEGAHSLVRRKVEGSETTYQARVQHGGRVEESRKRVHAWAMPEEGAMVPSSGLHLCKVAGGTAMHGLDVLRWEQMVSRARKPS